MANLDIERAEIDLKTSCALLACHLRRLRQSAASKTATAAEINLANGYFHGLSSLSRDSDEVRIEISRLGNKNKVG